MPLIEAPMDVFTPKQIADIQASEGPHTIFKDCYRIKQYVKPGAMLDDDGHLVPPAHLPFPQPYQVASAWTGSDWNVCNRTFLGQLQGCNLACPYCYVADGASTVQVAADEYVLDFDEYNKLNPGARAGVLRISGGEPMLFQEWVEAVIRCSRPEIEPFSVEPNPNWCGVVAPYIWVDTNGTLEIADSLLDVLSWPGVGVNLCFKYQADLDVQLRIAESLIYAGVDTYFYLAAWADDEDHIKNLENWTEHVWHGLFQISTGAPLRSTVVQIKEYEAAQARGYSYPRAEAMYRDVLEDWSFLMALEYKPEELWLPSNQVVL